MYYEMAKLEKKSLLLREDGTFFLEENEEETKLSIKSAVAFYKKAKNQGEVLLGLPIAEEMSLLQKNKRKIERETERTLKGLKDEKNKFQMEVKEESKKAQEKTRKLKKELEALEAEYKDTEHLWLHRLTQKRDLGIIKWEERIKKLETELKEKIGEIDEKIKPINEKKKLTTEEVSKIVAEKAFLERMMKC